MIEIEAPDGSIIEFPEGTNDATITSVMAREYGAPKPQPDMMQRAGNVWEGIKSGATFGLGPEIQAGVAGAYVGARNLLGMDTGGLTMSGANKQAYQELEANRAQAAQDPWAYLPGEVTGAIATGAGITKALPQATGALTQFASKGLPQALLTAQGIGGVSGALYGAGSGEGTLTDRAKSAQMGGAVGSLAGPAGAMAAKTVAGPLTNRVMEILKKRQAQVKIPPTVGQMTPEQSLGQLVQKTQDAQQLTYGQAVNSKALNQVEGALKKDYPDNYQQIMNAWKESDQPLAVVAGPALTRKAMGAAQYETALPKTTKYFGEQISEAKDKLVQSVYRNLGDSKSYYATVDDVLSKGRKKAAPLYNKAYTKEIDPSFQFKPEIQSAIDAARKKYPSELEGLKDNSIKVLDYAKKELDDQIGSAKRSGENNFARARTDVKDELLSAMDQASPDYAKARAVAGDYLKVTDAMEVGQNFVRFDPAEITTTLKSASNSEKDAFKIGFSKAIANRINDTAEGANPYNRVFGSKTKQEQLKAILSPEEYKRLEIDMKATNRLFDMKNKVLGNSTTTSKAMAASEISDDALMEMATQPRKSIANFIRNKLTSGGKTAEAIADLLYETDPTKKLVLLERISGSEALTKAEKQIVKEQYFNLDDRLRVMGAGVGGQVAVPKNIPEATIRPEQTNVQN